MHPMPRKVDASLQEIKNYIPYRRARNGQIQLALAVKEAFEKEKILLARYPTGIGKTISVIAGALAADAQKIIYLARSRSQFQAPIREVRRLESLGFRVPTVVLMNKQRYCLLRGSSTLSYREFLHFCWSKRKTGACPYSLEVDLKGEFPGVLTPKISRELGLENNTCPFELTWKYVRSTRLIVASYPYVFHSELRKHLWATLGGALRDSVLIIDEAHNLPSFIVETDSYTLSEYDLRRTISALKRLGGPVEVLSDLVHALNFMRRYKRMSNGGRGLKVEDLLHHMPSIETIAKYLFSTEESAETSTFMWRVYSFLQALRDASHDHVVSLSAGDEGVVLKISLVNPRRVSSQVFSDVRSAVLMSGTLPPRDYLQVMLDIPEERLLESSYPYVWGSNVEVVIVEGFSSRYVSRDEYLYRKYAKAIDLIFSFPSVSRAVVVFPSYSFMMSIVPYIQSRPFVFERRDSPLKALLGKMSSSEKILVLVVARGKFVEGVEYTLRGKSLVDTIIIAGLPVPEPTIENEKMYEILAEKIGDKNLAWKYVYLYPAYTQVIQSIGRGIRSERDKVKVYILDDRMRGEGETYLASYDFVVSLGKLPV
jgi:DNA excision repair protein ERCC-2